MIKFFSSNVVDYDRAEEGDLWFEEFYDELENIVYRGVTDGRWTLKEVEELAKRDEEQNDTEIGGSVWHMIERMENKERVEGYADCETLYDEWVKDIEKELEGKLKETAEEAEVRYCDALSDTIELLNRREEKETQKTIVKKKAIKKKTAKWEKATKKKKR